jgi:hypothetical protein
MDQFIRSVFPELDGKRLSELTPAQRDDSNEDWIRANQAFTSNPIAIAFLLRRIDALRRHIDELRRLLVMAPDLYQFVHKCAAFDDEYANEHLRKWGRYSQFEIPDLVRAARELLKKIDDPSRS